MTRSLLAALALLVIVPAVLAQSSPYTPHAPLPLGDNLLNLPTPRTLARGAWEVRFTHRFSQPIGDGDVHSLWGLDSSADVGIGLSWAPVRDLQISAFRIDVQDDIELAAKYSILQQAPAVPLSISARGGLDVRTEEGIDDRTSFFAQLILSRQFGRKGEVFVIPTYASNAAPFDHAFNVPVGAAFAIRPYLSLIVEVVPPNGDLPDDMESDFGWSVGLKRALGGHYFEVMLTDTRATNVDQYVSGGFLGGIDASDVHLGFNISRRFGSRRR
jgi:hypothetical protein